MSPVPERGPSKPRDIFGVLSDHEVDYLLIGGLAVIAHGYERVTADVDLLIAREPENLRRLGTALEELGAEVLGPDDRFAPLDLSHAESLGIGNHNLRTRSGGLDLFTQVPGSGPYAELRKRAIDVEVGGVTVRLVSRDDLIRMKRESGRPDDLADIAAIEDAAQR